MHGKSPRERSSRKGETESRDKQMGVVKEEDLVEKRGRLALDDDGG